MRSIGSRVLGHYFSSFVISQLFIISLFEFNASAGAGSGRLQSPPGIYDNTLVPTSPWVTPNMADEANSAGPPLNAGPPGENPLPALHLFRHDTSSTVGSGYQAAVPLPPGFYTLPIHGNCPRCHHYHRAATINVRVSGDFSQPSHVYCEKCKQKWLAFGGGNSTRISLLSTHTTEPDLPELNFRKELIGMVRSVTSIASPAALASVPEQPSVSPSREISVRSRNINEGQESNTAHSRSPISGHDIFAASTSGRDTARTDQPPTGVSHTSQPSKRRGKVYQQLKIIIKDHFRALRKLRLKPYLRGKKAKVSDKGRGKLPLPQADPIDDDFTASKKTQTGNSGIQSRQDTITGSDCNKVDQPNPAEAQDSPMKEMLQKMNEAQRVAWIREQFADYKCRCPSQCFCRRVPESTSPPHASDSGNQRTNSTPSPMVSPQDPQPHDFFMIGSHFHGFQAGDLHYDPARLLSNGSQTRLSQEATAVDTDSITVTSNPSYLDIAQPHSHRSRSPRPMSPPPPPGPSRLRQSIGPDELEGRPSIDLFTSGTPVRNTSRVGSQMERRSTSSADSAPTTENGTAPDLPATHVNGYRTSDERNRRSSSTSQSH